MLRNIFIVTNLVIQAQSNWLTESDALQVTIDSGILNPSGSDTSVLTSEHYWSRSCQTFLQRGDNFDQNYWMEFDYDSEFPNNYVFTIDAGKDQQLASVYIHVPQLITEVYTHKISGKLKFGASPDHITNDLCANIEGAGYYTCGSVMVG